MKNGTAKNRIAYTYGGPTVPQLPDGWLQVDVEDLVASLVAAIIWFYDELDANPELSSSASAKLALMLQDQPL